MPEQVKLLEGAEEPRFTGSEAKIEGSRRAVEAERDGSTRNMLRGDKEAPEQVASGAEAAGPTRARPCEGIGASRCVRPKTEVEEATWSPAGAESDDSERTRCCKGAGEPRLVGSSAEVEAPR